MNWVFRLTQDFDTACISELQMDRRTFGILCDMVRDIGDLKDTKNMSLQEAVAIFVYVLAHHKNNRTMSLLFLRSGETISRHFNSCLLTILKLHSILLKKSVPITEDCQDNRWRCFKFIYVLPGWEGSAHDGRVLRDAMIRSDGLKVSQGCYYLVDSGYCNADGFLAPFRGQRYHLNEFHGHRPHRVEEYFNMKHLKARNVIERCFALLKGRWKILASPSFFPIETQVCIILTCCFLHNLIRKYMSFDPQELEPLEEYDMEDEHFEDDEYVMSITPTEEWTNFRNTLALEMMEQDQIVQGRGRNKCFWTENEVQVLIATLQDMACDPSWKTNGGFKSNYMAEVHERMLSKIPTLTKQVTPHIESKIKWLKTRFHIINDMCRQSGCQWNDVEKKIACEKQWFDSYYQTDKEAKGMWDFKFPYLNQHELVYGRDRATGAVIQGYVDAIYNLEVDQNDESGGENLGALYHSSNVYEEDNNMYFESESTPTALHNTDVTNLPSGDVFKAANIFTADKDKIDVLFNLPLELRRNYVVKVYANHTTPTSVAKGRLKVVKIDHDANPELISEYKVYGLSSLIIFKNGQKVPESKREGPITKVKLKEYLDNFWNPHL
ncbi:hypothetical protein ZIOFF_019619 [Zingiber officinale]|uniref:Uncharacterized protein n=1 Tax=Zingiber officinale TaxID=94328 RepID=A0A8J5LN31_ZINOF|nr:hypothetical protein ZIOFF_019619 [Zingiber officinale]